MASSFFNFDSNSDNFPAPVDLSHHLSRTTRARQASSIKEFYKYFQIPGIGQLAGGLPNEYYFPYDTLEAKVALPDRFKPTPNKPVDPPTHALASVSISDKGKKGKYDSPSATRLLVPHASGASDPLRTVDLRSALQYGQAQGYPSLYRFIREFTRNNLHPFVPYKEGPEIILTCGSTDGFSKTVQALCDEWSEGHDPIWEKPGLLCEQYTYMNAVQTAMPRGMNMTPVAIDDEGMLAEGKGGLEDVLENWDFTKGRRPHLMYTVTIGQNPTGCTLSIPRRKQIYALCVKYDVIIIEDDPYWYLQFPTSAPNTPAPKPRKSSGFEFLDSLIPSYLSIDYQGRVVRLDTFSKTVAPGCRLGWITAQPALVERILRITECSTQQPSGFVQAMIAELIMGPSNSSDPGRGGAADGSGWKVDGWVRWLEGLRGNYERRMNKMCDILDDGKVLLKQYSRLADDVEDEWAIIKTTKIYDFVRPLGGMFIWVRFDFTSHPLYKAKKYTLAELSRGLWVYFTKSPYKVLVAPGTMFAPTEEIREGDAWNCFRLCFAAIDEDEVEGISKRFVDAAQSFWNLKKIEPEEQIRVRAGKEEEREDGGLVALTGMC
ncbi:PLP-dependent transferase [Delitschia confertaspora ATCC 74209]|uniref:PLP-dependent transferase n=1 Tax=Delitschia confertaspora ATCC 74209 TaxID=1513339 RepID=A0A9P4JLS7_9PLEO|nr:PLP-dependent transferase [Delitschia confertaspora ATCC 74209]